MTQMTGNVATKRARQPKTAGEQPVLSPAERAELGKAARARVPRESHALTDFPADRPDPVGQLEQQAATRVPELVPVRYGRMLLSPFSYFRGAALPMASDLARTPVTGLTVQACGDAHLSNFGIFGSPERRLVFDVNDFDETLPGPWEWDVKRLAASFAVAGRGRGFDRRTRGRIVETACARYRETMRTFAGMRNLDVWYARLDIESLFGEVRKHISASARRQAERNLAKTRRKDSLRALSKLTEVEDGERRLISDPPLIVPLGELFTQFDADAAHETIHEILRTYRASLPDAVRHLVEGYRYVDAARKVVGVGSVGTRAFVALLLGRDDEDPLFLQLKEARASVLEPFTAPSEYENSGRRVVEGQRLMQAASDVVLGWIRATGVDGVQRDFYVRQLWDGKGSAMIDSMEPRAMEVYGHMCGWTLARAHARSGDRIAIGRYLGSGRAFDRAMAEFAEFYADQNERDHRAFTEAIDAGRVPAEMGV